MAQFPIEERLKVITNCRRTKQAGGFTRPQTNQIAVALGINPGSFANKDLLCDQIINVLLPTIPPEYLQQMQVKSAGALPTNRQIAEILNDYGNRIAFYGSGGNTAAIQAGQARAVLTKADSQKVDVFHNAARVVAGYPEQITNPEIQLATFAKIGKETIKRIKSILVDGKLPAYDTLPPIPAGAVINYVAPSQTQAAQTAGASSGISWNQTAGASSGISWNQARGSSSTLMPPSLFETGAAAAAAGPGPGSSLSAPLFQSSMTAAPLKPAAGVPLMNLPPLLGGPSPAQPSMIMPSLMPPLQKPAAAAPLGLAQPSLMPPLQKPAAAAPLGLAQPSLAMAAAAAAATGSRPSLVQSISTSPSFYNRVDNVARQIGQMTLQADKEAVLDAGILDLMTLHGIGEKKALKWRSQGIQNIDDLRAKFNNKTLPFTLTEKQFLAIKYRKDFAQKIPRNIVKDVGEVLIDNIAAMIPGTIGEITGSYRRGNPESSDVDILLTHPQGLNPLDPSRGLIKYLLSQESGPFLIGLLSEGNTQIQGIFKVGDGIAHKIDIKFAKPDQWASELLHATGNDNFNQFMSKLAIMKGMKLNKDGLYLRDSSKPGEVGTKFDIKTEEGFFSQLGLEYIPPTGRNFTEAQRFPQTQISYL